MKKAMAALLGTLILMTATQALAAQSISRHRSPFDCHKPDPPAVPDGANATAEEMSLARSDGKRYMGLMTRYLGCIEHNLGGTGLADFRNSWYRDMFREQHRFNRQLKTEVAKFETRED